MCSVGSREAAAAVVRSNHKAVHKENSSVNSCQVWDSVKYGLFLSKSIKNKSNGFHLSLAPQWFSWTPQALRAEPNQQLVQITLTCDQNKTKMPKILNQPPSHYKKQMFLLALFHSKNSFNTKLLLLIYRNFWLRNRSSGLKVKKKTTGIFEKSCHVNKQKNIYTTTTKNAN